MGLILIIDDDSSVRGTMKRILERDGHEVREPEDGAIGLKLSREEPPDVVVTDLLMPEKDGIETIMELRAEFPDVGILAVSGGDKGSTGGRLLDAQALGADAPGCDRNQEGSWGRSGAAAPPPSVPGNASQCRSRSATAAMLRGPGPDPPRPRPLPRSRPSDVDRVRAQPSARRRA